MATIHSGDGTQHARNGAQKTIAFRPAQGIGDLSRIVDHDIEILKIKLEQVHDGRDEARSNAWERLESAWQTVRSELDDDKASGPLSADEPPSAGATGFLEPSISARIREAMRWSCERARRVELRATALKAWRFATSAALAVAKHVRTGWRGLQGAVRRHAQSLESPWLRLKETSARAIDSGGVCSADWEQGARLRLASAIETAKSTLALIDGGLRPIPGARASAQPDELTTTIPETPFVLQPMPWVLGALSPVISARTMMLHGSYHADCVESANRLARDHKELAGKTSLEIIGWACDHARGTELLTMASEAWNHSFYWQCLTPVKKRPREELGKALDRMFGDFSNFAEKFALAGATHVGSGWLWLTANSRKQVRILTTSDADCPEARGHTCLLAIDLWEHAYYLDHQNRRREYLDALIDRKLDWDFAEQRFCHVLSESAARRNADIRANTHKRPYPKRQCAPR
jgi:Fe-Mn family superoxide dismutase